MTVNGGGTLGGTGIITGAVTVYGGGIVSPGNGIGILTLGALDLSNGGTLLIQVSGYSTAGTSFDQLKVTGTLTLGGNSTLLLDLKGLSTHGTATGFVLDGSETGLFGTISTINPFERILASGELQDESQCAVVMVPTGGPGLDIFSPSSQITAVAPPHSAGDWDITVTTPGGTSALSSGDQFRSESATDVTLAQAA